MSERKTKHRRRFHTDRIVAARRARFKRERSPWMTREVAANRDEWVAKTLSYGRLSDSDPWDCGNPRCGCCHFEKQQPGIARERARRTWAAV